MKTNVIENKGLAHLDEQILIMLESIDVGPMSDGDEDHFLIGVRNEYNLIYREIDVTSLEDFFKVVEIFEELGFVDEFGHAYRTMGGYDAIFSPGSLH
jgi:hypothetical protein